MILVVVYVNVHISNAENGRNTPASLPNVDGADAQNTAAKNVRKVLGFTTGTGALQLSSKCHYFRPVDSFNNLVNYHTLHFYIMHGSPSRTTSTSSGMTINLL